MTIEIICTCGKKLRVQPHLAGKRVACPACKTPITIPASQPRAPQPSEPQPRAPQPAVHDDLWDDLPALSAPERPAPSSSVVAATRASAAREMMAHARADQVEKQQEFDAWGTGKLVSGIAMTVGAVVWFGLGLMIGRIYIYPPIMFVVGLYALIDGINQKLTRRR